MALQGSGQISASNIANEFGYTNGSETRLGSYRTTNGQGNFPVSFGALQFNSIDAQSGGSVPTSGQIKFSDFYSTRLQQVVNFYGSGRGGNRLIAKDRYNAGGSNDVNVVGNYRTRPNDTSGTKVHIHVNQTIGSEKSNVQHCALRTGSWSSSTILQVDIGGSGRIRGGGGAGIPAGAGGAEGSGGVEGGPGNAGTATAGGTGGGGGNNDGEAVAGGGGTGGSAGEAADNGGTGFGGEGSSSGGGAAGPDGAAIRRNSGFTVNVSNSGTLSGSTNSTGVL